MKRVSASDKSVEQIAEEWDRLAEIRSGQIRSGLDDSLSQVLAPAVIELLQKTDTHCVIDIGCGTGWLTEKIAEFSGYVVALDMSRRSLELAMLNSGLPNIKYTHNEFQHYSRTHQEVFTVALANMTLLTVIDLASFLQAVANVVRNGGHFVFTIAHPCYWPLYWDYADCSWFNYLDEILIEAPFKISSQCTDCVTTHVHRPLEQYFNALSHSGFAVERVIELMGKGFALPRFLAVKSCKVSKNVDGHPLMTGESAPETADPNHNNK